MTDTMIPQKNVLLVDDEDHILHTSALFLQSSGITGIISLNDSSKVLPTLETGTVSVVVLDLQMPTISGLELLPKIVLNHPQIPVIIVTANDEIDTVVECIKAGAFDYLVKPINSSRLTTSVRRALEMCDLANELSSLKQCLFSDQINNPAIFAPIVTGNRKMRSLFQYMEIVAGTRQPVMITGETGTGKELIARAIHKLSGRSGEFVALNVAGLDDNMFSDTLFGHKKGAFTGAEQAREGMIARAVGGTLFLDEIGDLNETSQIKLLRLLQEHEYFPVGSDIVKKSDARILLATNKDLKELIKNGKFRNDLYYRLYTHQLTIPPLRERMDDIPLLLDHFLEAAAKEYGKKKPTIPSELLTILQLHPFPGNIRELEALVYDAVARHESGILSMEHFRKIIDDERPETQTRSHTDSGDNPLVAMFGRFPTTSEVEEYMIGEAMKLAKGNQGIAASLLGINRQTLNKRLKAAKS